MATDEIKVTSPVKIQPDSKERVALELMHHISGWEGASKEQKMDRKYWFALYKQCLKTTKDYSLESILKEE